MNIGAQIELQKEVCGKYGAKYTPSPLHLKVGVSESVKLGEFPLNGFRHPAENETTGWFFYSGEEMSTDDQFFKALHVIHLQEWCPKVIKFLGLPPGWRFLLAGGYEDVWFDKSLLKPS